MIETSKLGKMEAIFLIVSITINHIILNSPQSIINLSGASSLINVIYITIVALILVLLICKLLGYFPHQNIIDISEFLGGKFLKYAIGFVYILYFIFCVSIYLRSFCDNLKIIFFTRTPIIYLIILFILGTIICCRLGITAIIRANLIFMPLIIFSILFVFIANLGNLNFFNALPILGNGFDATFISGLSNLFAFSGIAFLYFIPSELKDSKEFKKIARSSVILSGILLLFSVAALLFLFPSIYSKNNILPLYLASRTIEFGRFFQRLDPLFLLIWIFSMTSYFSILVSYIVKIFIHITNIKSNYLIIYIVSIICLLLSLLPKNYSDVYFLQTQTFKYAVGIIVFGISFIILILATIKFKRKNHLLKGDKSIE